MKNLVGSGQKENAVCGWKTGATLLAAPVCPTSPPLRPWTARFAHAAAIEARRFAGSRAEVLTKTGRNSS
jgi:hypothetical protein